MTKFTYTTNQNKLLKTVGIEEKEFWDYMSLDDVEIRKNENLSTEIVYQIKFKDKSTQMTDGRSFRFIKQ